MSDYDVHARTYDSEYGATTEDLDFYVDLARETGGPALELAVGTGRVALPVARGGVAVLGVDSSPAMLAKARARLEREPELPLTLVEGDMRTVDLTDRGPFSLVYVPARAFLHLLTPRDQLAALETVHRHLADDGLFAGNIFYPDVGILERRSRRQDPWERTGEFEDPDSGHLTHVYESSRVDLRRHLIHAMFRTEQVDGEGVVVKTAIRELVLTWIWPRELSHLFARAGLELVEIFGDFDGTPFSEGGDELVWIARKA